MFGRFGAARRRFRDWAAFLVFPAVLAALYFWFSYKLYGSLNPTAVSWQGAMDGKQTAGLPQDALVRHPLPLPAGDAGRLFLRPARRAPALRPDLFLRLPGLLPDGPRGSPSRPGSSWRIAAPYALVSAFLTQRTGYAPQARPLVAAIWAPILFLGAYLASERKRIFTGLFNAAAGVSLLITWLLLQNPLALYQETTAGRHGAGRRPVLPPEQSPPLPAPAAAVLPQGRGLALDPEFRLARC